MDPRTPAVAVDLPADCRTRLSVPVTKVSILLYALNADIGT